MALSKNEKKIIKLIVIVLLILVAWQLFYKLALLFGGLGSLIALLVLLGLAYYLLVKERWLDKI